MCVCTSNYKPFITENETDDDDGNDNDGNEDEEEEFDEDGKIDKKKKIYLLINRFAKSITINTNTGLVCWRPGRHSHTNPAV